MNDQPEDKRGGSCALFAALALIAVVAAYPLSGGPVLWLYSKGYVTSALEPFILALYWPINWLYEHSKAFAGLVDRYLSLWQ